MLALALVVVPVCYGSYRGADPFGGGFESVPRLGGMADWHPLSAYVLDWHVDASVTNPAGLVANQAQGLANTLWTMSAWLVATMLNVFSWCFSQDFLTGRDGALDAMSDAVSAIRGSFVDGAWFDVGIIVLGMWATWRAIAQRQYTNAFAGIAISVAVVALMLFIVNRPQESIGQLAKWTNSVSLSFLSLGEPTLTHKPEVAQRRISDSIFNQAIYKPWAILQFGGLKVCTSNTAKDSDGFPLPVSPNAAGSKTCRDTLLTNNRSGGYTEKFLSLAPGSKRRVQLYEALRDGEPLPSSNSGPS